MIVLVERLTITLSSAVATGPVWSMVLQLQYVGMTLVAEVLTDFADPVEVALLAGVVVD